MEIDFSALASRVAAFSDVLGCVILSADGLVLGVFPPGDGDGDGVKPAWLRFAGLGEPDRGFVRFSRGEVWAYVSVGSYAAFAVATGTTRPGVLLDHLEQALLVATESRDLLEMARAPGHLDLAGSRPKATPEREARAVDAETPRGPGGAETDEPAADAAATASEQGGSEAPSPEGPPEEPEQKPQGDEEEVDRVVLAREFAGLLQEDTPDDEDKA